jgi:UDP-MurNAc hydroxylase
MKTSIEFVNHASVLISNGEVSILTDPWYSGSAFHDGWKLLTETDDNEVKNILDRTSHIWISHEHPDHFSIKFFKMFKQQIIDRSINVLFQKTDDRRVVKFLKSINVNYSELSFNHFHELGENTSVCCIKDGFYDSALLVKSFDEKILNLNDCEINTPRRVQEVRNVTGEVDILLTQFSYAAWKGGKDNKAWRIDAAQEKLNTIALQVKAFNPAKLIPFASFIYFSNELNFYLNDTSNKPKTVYQNLVNHEWECLIMKPGDVVGGSSEKYCSSEAIAYWEDRYQMLDGVTPTKYQSKTKDELVHAFERYCERISKNNSLVLMRILRRFSPISVFSKIEINLIDSDFSVTIDYLQREITFNKLSQPCLEMHSASLLFLFENNFGFDTLTVNGCFEEKQKGGFIHATKSLAVENLNNLGISISIKTLFRFSVIKIFITRLYRVARKLET